MNKIIARCTEAGVMLGKIILMVEIITENADTIGHLFSNNAEYCKTN